jgi:hypothetical protein
MRHDPRSGTDGDRPDHPFHYVGVRTGPYMEWKGSGDGGNDGVVVENRTADPKHVEVDCRTSDSTVFSEAVRLAPGEATSYSDLPDRMIEVNARAADGPKGRSMFGPDAVSGAIVAQITDDDVTFETTTGPYDPDTRDYTPSDTDHGGDDGTASDAAAAGDDDGTAGDAGDATGETTTERPTTSTTRREQRDRSAATADRDARGGSTADPSGSSAQPTRSRSAGETPARSAPESSGGDDANTTGRTTGRGTDERVAEPGRQSSTTPSEAGGPDRTTPDRSGVDEYLTGSEEVKKVLTGDTRLFAVTDRRILDVTQSTAASGASVEEVESTLFSYVTGVDVSITGPTTNVDLTQRVLGAAVAIVGLLVAVASLAVDAGDVTLLGVLVGLLVIGVGAWIYYNASERVPGGIRITFSHTGGHRGSGDSYLLPEGQGNAAREVVRQLGTAHAPDPEPESMEATSAPPATAESGSRAGPKGSDR